MPNLTVDGIGWKKEGPINMLWKEFERWQVKSIWLLGCVRGREVH
jgi:hypothetical protein